ncbi:MAG: hypothetical protein A3J38_04655 [Gammaproteobacteria bacterium RIFCSPHIGHO2_12_FULL_45_9]|nr:MAG: hypothetical protein A3J38_04655 [Gammaproteobacteria bacterium RIFCSPHIGHO2_12_FULL_45_9]
MRWLAVLLSCIGIAPVVWGSCLILTGQSTKSACSTLWLNNVGKATWTLSNKITQVPGGGWAYMAYGNATVNIPSEGYAFPNPGGGHAGGGAQDTSVPKTLRPGEKKEVQWCVPVTAAASSSGADSKEPELIIEYRSNFGQIIVLDYMMREDGCAISSVSSLPSDTLGYVTHTLYHSLYNTPPTNNDSVATYLGTPPGGTPNEIDWNFKMQLVNAPTIAAILQEKMQRLQPLYTTKCSSGTPTGNPPLYPIACHATLKNTGDAS